MGFPTPPSQSHPQSPPYSPRSSSKGLSAVRTLSDPQPPPTSGPLHSLLPWPGMPSRHTPTGLPPILPVFAQMLFLGWVIPFPPSLTDLYLPPQQRPQDTHGCLFFTTLPRAVRAWQATVHEVTTEQLTFASL